MSIDADDLIKAFEALDLMNGQYAESFTNMAGNRSMEIESAINSKTIDTKPIVHAHWIEQEHEIFKCSNCGNYHGRGTKIIHDYDLGRNYGLYMATQIIDKYKAYMESE